MKKNLQGRAIEFGRLHREEASGKTWDAMVEQCYERFLEVCMALGKNWEIWLQNVFLPPG